ncbi:MAG: hypothetical protein LKJ76_03900 [Lachnospiraceae bacterium]|nr:hypothetical protein [Lachnospiraceae bacterium]
MLKMGKAKVTVDFSDACWPSDGFVGVHDNCAIRMLVFEQERDGIRERFAIAAIDITSLFDDAVDEFRKTIHEKAEVPEANCWICATHNFTTPHLWRAPSPRKPDIPRPGHPVRTQEEIERSRMIKNAYCVAVEKAAEEAGKTMDKITVLSGCGTCDVNASRNMETKDGWWLGVDAGEYSDHSIPTALFCKENGRPIALIYGYDCQGTVTAKSELASGGKLISSDLLGNASAYVEKEFGDGFVALGLCGGCGDQEPQFRAVRQETDISGNLRTVDMHEAGYALLEAGSARLGAEVLKAAKKAFIVSSKPVLRAAAITVDLKTQYRDPILKNLHPTRSYVFKPDGRTESTVINAMIIGNFALVGTKAELASITSHTIRDKSPVPVTAVVTMLNGAAKYMVDAEAYDKMTYGAMNSLFVKGSAEILRDEMISMLGSMYPATDTAH